MSARTGFIAGLTAAVAAVTVSVWVLNRDGEGAPAPSNAPDASPSEVARPEGVAQQTAAEEAAGDRRQDVLAKPPATPASDPDDGAGDARPSGAANDAGLGATPGEPTNTERFAQEIAANLGWPALGPYEANQLGAEAAQFTGARDATLTAFADGNGDPSALTALTRSAEGLAVDWIERFGRSRAAQLVQYLSVTAFDPATGEPQLLDLDALAQSRRER